jgi:hypothetical protein
MDEIHIADDCDNNGLESASGEPLNNSSNEKHMVVGRTSAQNRSNDTHYTRKQKDRPFAEFARERTDKWASGANNEKLITSELSDCRDGSI